MLGSCQFVGKKVLVQVLIIFVRRMAYGNSLFEFCGHLISVGNAATFTKLRHVTRKCFLSWLHELLFVNHDDFSMC